MIKTELRKSGIDIIGDIHWGTHFCHFYETKDDLLDILIPYFKAGLENNEFCLWIIFPPHSEEEMRGALRQAIPGVDQRLAAGDIEILPHAQWFFKDGSLDLQRVMVRWQEKLVQALAKGYAGMRVNGNEAWLTKEEWKDFSAYEEKLDNFIADQRMIALCAYCVSLIPAAGLFDATRTHQFAIARRYGKWEVVETPELKQAKAELKRLNEELELRIAERTSELAASNQDLIREVSERRQAEESLRESEEKYRKLFESSHDIIYFSDRAGNILDINPRAEQLTGYPQSDLRKMNIFQHLIVQEDQPIIREVIKDIFEGRSRTYKERWKTREGKIIYFDGLSVPQISQNGEVLSTFCTLRDITDHELAEEALRKSQQLLQMVLATLPVGVAVIDQAGDIVLVNEASKRIWGGMIVSGRERWAKSKGFWHDSGKRIAPTNWASVRALSEGQTSLNELIDIEPFDGQKKTIHNSSAPIRNAEGLIVGAVTVNEDVTERVRAEEALRDNSRLIREMAAHLVEMDEAGRQKLSQELHDRIGQILTALSINLNIIRGQISGDLQEKIVLRIDDSLSLVEEAVSRVRDVMEDLRPPVLDDYGLLAALRWYGKQFFSRTGIAVKIRGKEISPRPVPNVETVLFRIVQEAFTNISKHAKATEVVVILKSDKNSLCLSIGDDGIGFHPSEETGSSKHQGWGLITMSERAGSLGGSFRIESRPKRGTKVVVTVPR